MLRPPSPPSVCGVLPVVLRVVLSVSVCLAASRTVVDAVESGASVATTTNVLCVAAVAVVGALVADVVGVVGGG